MKKSNLTQKHLRRRGLAFLNQEARDKARKGKTLNQKESEEAKPDADK